MFYGGQLVYLLVCFVCYETMALKNFFFRENWVWSKEAGMKIAFFFCHFWPNLDPHFSPKSPNMEVLKQNFNFEYLRITETILLPNTWLKDWLTKVKSSKKVIFSYFWPKMGEIFVPISFKNGVSITTTSWF